MLGPVKQIEQSNGTLTIRYAGAADREAIARLAQLDSSRAPSGTVLVAEIGGEPWAAVSINDAHVVADPFRPTGELTLLLIERARQLRPSESRRRLRPRALRPALLG